MNQNDLEEAAKLLASFSCLEIKPVGSEKVNLVAALELFTSLSDYQNFGICADSSTQGLEVLVSYLLGLGYKLPSELAEVPVITAPIYLKFSTQRSGYHIDRYSEEYRGVLISCQSQQCDRVNGTYGYLPLDLFLPTD